MFRPPFLRLPLITLALVMASCASAQPQDAPRHPDAIICAVAVHGAAPGTIIPVPPGRNPTDFCPENSMIRGIYNLDRPGVSYSLPWAPGGSPPPIWPKRHRRRTLNAASHLSCSGFSAF